MASKLTKARDFTSTEYAARNAGEKSAFHLEAGLFWDEQDESRAVDGVFGEGMADLGQTPVCLSASGTACYQSNSHDTLLFGLAIFLCCPMARKPEVLEVANAIAPHRDGMSC